VEFIKSKILFLFSKDYSLFLFSGCAAICMDLGHLTLKRGTHQTNNDGESLTLKVIKIIFRFINHCFLKEY
jgi:hypothetical protein